MQQGPHAGRAQFGSRSGSMCITIAATSLQSFVLGSVERAQVGDQVSLGDAASIGRFGRLHHRTGLWSKTINCKACDLL
jgi:hypothetical protein